MDNKNPINDLMQESMAKIRELADTNTIVGQPIQTPDGVTLIPISRVSMAMGGGGTIFGKKKDDNPEGNLGTGLGVGVKVDPVAFLIVKDGMTRVLPVAAPPITTVDRIVEMVPDVMDKVTNFIDSRKKKEDEAPVADEEAC